MAAPNKDFNVAIVGGGMCGLVCAVPLYRAGINIRIFEAAPKFGEIGAAVAMGPNCIRALKSMGLFENVLAKSTEQDLSFRAFKYVSGFGEHEELYDYASASAVDNGMGIYRPFFIDAMAEMLDPSVTQFNKKCIKVERLGDGSNLIQFSDGSSHIADVVIGADGIKSAVRQAVTGEETDSHMVFSNTVAYRGLIPTETLKMAGVKTVMDDRPLCWMGPDHHLITFPIKCRSVINIVVFATKPEIPLGSVQVPLSDWAKPVPESEMFEEFEGWGRDVQIILRLLKNPLKWSIHMLHPPLDRYVRGRTAVVGDAAHGMLPHLGAGFGQGCEDALLLTRLLVHPYTKKSNLEEVLKAYDTIRRPRGNFVLDASTRMGVIYDTYFPNSAVSSAAHVEQLRDRWTPVWFQDFDDDFLKAKEKLGW